MRRVYANKAAEKLQLGTEETENALILDKIEAHIVITDHSTKVRDAISAERLEQIIAEARVEAPRLIEYGMARYAESIEARRLGGSPQ